MLDATPRGSDTFHDALGREIRTRSSSGIETRTEYVPLETRHWDGGQADASSSYEHTPTLERKDGLGRVVAHVSTLQGQELASSYTYDPSGALLSRTDPEGHTARYDYDGRGRRVAVHDPDLGEHRFTYDATGNVITRRYPDGATARFTFDLGGRSLTEDWNGDGAPEIGKTWDVSPGGAADPLYRGKLARVTEPGGSVEHTYDARGRITSTRYEIDGTVYVVGSEYDAQDRETLHVYPDGSSLEIRRNARGQTAGYGAAVDLAYGDDGLETERRFSTGVVAKSGYDAERRRSELTFVASGGSVIEHLRWTYDHGGNLTSLADLRPGIGPERDRSETYTYDNLYRLAGAHGAWGETSYRYSSSGNLLGRTSTVPSQTLHAVTYGERPHVPAAFDGRAVEVDARGRMTNDGVRTYTWNEVDQLVAVARTDGGAVENVYGDDGVRRSRVEHRPDGTSTTTHFIDAWSEAQDGKLTRYIVHAGQRIVKLADGTGAVAASAESGGRRDVTSERGRSIDARAASAPSLGLLCVFAFALTLVTRKILEWRTRGTIGGLLRSMLRAAAIGGGLAVAATSAAPAMAALGVVLLAVLCASRITGVARVTRLVVASIGVMAAVAACGGGGGGEPHEGDATSPRGSIQALSDGDTLIATDLLGSVLGETSGTGAPKKRARGLPIRRDSLRHVTRDVEVRGQPARRRRWPRSHGRALLRARARRVDERRPRRNHRSRAPRHGGLRRGQSVRLREAESADRGGPRRTLLADRGWRRARCAHRGRRRSGTAVFRARQGRGLGSGRRGSGGGRGERHHHGIESGGRSRGGFGDGSGEQCGDRGDRAAGRVAR